MTLVFFFLRHTPFWAVPLFFLGIEFSFVYKLKGKKKISRFFIFQSILMIFIVAFYIYSGGPEKVVENFISIYNFLFFDMSDSSSSME